MSSWVFIFLYGGDIMNILIDHFKDHIEFPENLAELGVPQDTLLLRVDSTFLAGYVNIIDRFAVYLVDYYGDGCWDDKNRLDYFCKSFKKEGQLYDLTDSPDDIAILGETENSYWFLYIDKGCLKSLIGRMNKNVMSKDQFICKLEAMSKVYKIDIPNDVKITFT